MSRKSTNIDGTADNIGISTNANDSATNIIEPTGKPDANLHGYSERLGRARRKPGRKRSGSGTGNPKRITSDRNSRNSKRGASDTDFTAEFPSEIPFAVNTDDFSFAKISETVAASTVETIFDITSLLIGEHWKINKAESTQLAKNINQCFEKLPKSTLKKIRNATDKYEPFIALAITSFAIIKPRYDITIAEIELQKQGIHTSSAGSEGFATAEFDQAENHFTTDANLNYDGIDGNRNYWKKSKSIYDVNNDISKDAIQ